MWYAIQTITGKEIEAAGIYNSELSILDEGESVFSFNREIFQNIRRRDFTPEQEKEYLEKKERKDRIRKEYKAQRGRKREAGKNCRSNEDKINLRLFEKVEVPVFPSYIFLETESILSFRERYNSPKGYDLREALKVSGTGGYMVDMAKASKNSRGLSLGASNSEERFIPIGEAYVEQYMQMGGKEHVIRKSDCVMLENKKVKVIAGPLVGKEGLIESVNSHQREAKVWLEIFGRRTLVSLGVDLVTEI